MKAARISLLLALALVAYFQFWIFSPTSRDRIEHENWAKHSSKYFMGAEIYKMEDLRTERAKAIRERETRQFDNSIAIDPAVFIDRLEQSGVKIESYSQGTKTEYLIIPHLAPNFDYFGISIISLSACISLGFVLEIIQFKKRSRTRR